MNKMSKSPDPMFKRPVVASGCLDVIVKWRASGSVKGPCPLFLMDEGVDLFKGGGKRRSRYNGPGCEGTSENLKAGSGGKRKERENVAPASCVFTSECEAEFNHVGKGNRPEHLLVSIEGGLPGRRSLNFKLF